MRHPEVREVRHQVRGVVQGEVGPELEPVGGGRHRAPRLGQPAGGGAGLGPAVDDLRSGLRTYRGPDGAELLDTPDAATADEDGPAPVRFLASFDNAVLGHRDRTRLLPEPFRTTVMPGYSMVHATVLVDGFVAATWTVDGGVLAVRPLAPLPAGTEDDVLAEGARMAAFLDLDPGTVTLSR